MTARVAKLEDFRPVLQAGGYGVESGELADRAVLLAESPYALVAIIEAPDCAGIRETVSDVQAALTQLAAEVPSPRSWDLYLLLHVRGQVSDPADELVLEEIEADTRYVRKFVRLQVDADDPQAVDRALRPLLPLRPTPQFDLLDPLEALRAELRALDAPADLVDAAILSFETDAAVTIP